MIGLASRANETDIGLVLKLNATQENYKNTKHFWRCSQSGKTFGVDSQSGKTFGVVEGGF